MKSDRAEVAHIMRRAGFGATPSELDELTAEKTYEEIVDDLVNPERFPAIDSLYLDLYYDGQTQLTYMGKWLYRMMNTKRPLEEKMALFLHHIFPVAHGKSEHDPSIGVEIDTFRSVALTNFKTILLETAKDPAMIFWLDNNENHKDEINENWGRELLELFTMGIGNYTEDDIKSTSRAFTGWTFEQPLSLYPMGHHNAVFEYLPEDHDEGEKTFLGHTGNLKGEDIIDIIVKQPATARFISRHLYNFFVEDEPQVPAWSIEEPNDPEAIEQLSKVFLESEGDMRAVLKELFSSEFFRKSIDKKRVKSPVELVAGLLKQTGEFRSPKPGLHAFNGTAIQAGKEGTMRSMGQEMLNPPTVEGWHTGHEWIDSGTLGERVNFAGKQFSNASMPGVQEILQRAGTLDEDSADLVTRCLDLMGGIRVSHETHAGLVAYTEELKTMRKATGAEGDQKEVNVLDLLRMVVSTVDYQFA